MARPRDDEHGYRHLLLQISAQTRRWWTTTDGRSHLDVCRRTLKIVASVGKRTEFG
jgi:hypothetical protein